MPGSVVRLNEMVVAHPLHFIRMLLLLKKSCFSHVSFYSKEKPDSTPVVHETS